MKTLKSIFILLFLLSTNAWAQDYNTTIKSQLSSSSKLIKKQAPKNAVSLELLGRGLFYGIGYDRRITREVSLGAAFSYASSFSNPGVIYSQIQITSIPLYANYYILNSGQDRFVATGGVNMMSVQATVGFDSSQMNSSSESAESEEVPLFSDFEVKAGAMFAIPQVGLGYEYGAKNGFLLRTNIYGMYLVGKVLPFVGLSAGYAF